MKKISRRSFLQATATAAAISALAGCKTKSDAIADGTVAESTVTENLVTVDAQPIRLLAYSGNEKTANVVRDQLIKANFDVDLNLQSDTSGLMAVIYSGEYDLFIQGWTTAAGNPDYAVRSFFYSTGSANFLGINNEKVDELIDLGATQTPDEYLATYTELEQEMTVGSAIMVPLYGSLIMAGWDKSIIDSDTVDMRVSGALPWWRLSYVDASLNDTRTFNITQTGGSSSSYHTIRDNSYLTTDLHHNTSVRLLNQTADNELITEGTLTRDYVIAEGNESFYFLLRDDINFSKVENGTTVDTGVLVGAEDVKFSIEQAIDPSAVYDQYVYSLFENFAGVEIIADVEELKSATVSGSGESVYNALNASAPSEIVSVEASKANVDNASGKYQVVKISTLGPFPQALNFLSHSGAGILNEECVMAYNSLVDMENYDPTVDVLYGDAALITEGSTYDNQMWFSGPYSLISKNDYEFTLEKNDAFMPGDESEPKIRYIKSHIITDATSASSSLRSGTIDFLPDVDADSYEIIEADDAFETYKQSANAVTMLLINQYEGLSECVNADLRLAVYYAINQDDYVSVYNNLVEKMASPVSTVLDTGFEHIFDLSLSNEYLAKYQGK